MKILCYMWMHCLHNLDEPKVFTYRIKEHDVDRNPTYRTDMLAYHQQCCRCGKLYNQYDGYCEGDFTTWLRTRNGELMPEMVVPA